LGGGVRRALRPRAVARRSGMNPWSTALQIRKFGFDIVHGCQLRCVGCPNSVIKPRIQRVPVDVFAACLANVDVARVRLMRLFNFGEPLLHDDLPGIMEAVRKAPFELGLLELSTNAQHHDFVALEEALKVGALGRLP
jgi:molybdenum cofactor biosynthesis enzyme MoaA